MKSYNQFSVDVVRNIDEPMHLHPDIEVLYCLEGELEVQIRDKKYTMRKDDVIVVNSSVQHSLHLEGSNILCRVRYEYQTIVEMINNTSCMFLCNSCVNNEKSYDSIREILREIVYLEVLYTKKTDSYKFSLLYKLLDTLVEYYMEANEMGQVAVEEYGTDEKLQKIMHYIHQNFQNGVSLSELADQMYISTSTLSRFFKKQTGIYFAEYVNQVRIRYAISELLYSDKNITKIAMDCGFSNASVFNKVFRENYGMAPTEYRQRKVEEIQAQKQEQRQIQEALKTELQEKIIIREHEKTHGILSYELDVNDVKPYRKFWRDTLNFGPFGNMTRANVQYHLALLQENLRPRHVRFWSVFTDKLMITDGKTKGNYDFMEMDTVFDFLVSNHVKPALDFSSRMDIALRSVGDVVFANDDTVRFASREIFEDFFYEFIKHLVIRYGAEELRDWVFEIIDNPFIMGHDAFYEDEHYDYLNVYDYAYDVIRRLSPHSLIAGCGIISNGNIQSADQFLCHCAESGRVPDSIVFGMFPYEPLAEDGSVTVRTTDKDFELHEIDKLQDLVKKSGLKEVPIAIAEWNLTPSNRNFLNDSCFRGTYYCRTVAALWGKAVSLNTWTGSDWVSNYADVRGLCHGGAGLLTKDGIRKPLYYALFMLNMLGDEVISVGDGYIATRVRPDEYQILCFNFNWYSPNYFLQVENTVKPEELDSIFPEKNNLIIDMVLKGVSPNCTYVVKKRFVNRNHGSVLDEWAKFHYSGNLTRNDIKYLSGICIPGLQADRMTAREDRLPLHLTLEKHEFAIYHIYREDFL